MQKKSLLLIVIFAFFALLWLPFGQNDFLLDNWMKIGTFGAFFLLVGALSFCKEKPNFFQDLRWLAVLMLLAYIIHQFEEHWIDLFGQHYAFYDYMNHLILRKLDAPDSSIKPLDKESIFIINTSLVWLVGFLAIFKAPKQVFTLIAMASIVFVNAITHIIAAILNQEYNPGLFTAIVIFIPLYIIFVRNFAQMPSFNKKQLRFGLIWAVIAHVIMVAGMLAANWFRVIPQELYFGAMIFWSLLPAFLFNNNK